MSAPTPDRSKDHGWWPYLGPYGLFLLLSEISGRMPDELEGVMLALRVLAPGLLFVSFVVRGRYPELRGYRFGGASLLDVATGLLVAALWMGPFLLFTSLSRPEAGSGFDATLLGEGREPLAIGLRLLGFALFTPFIEELFVRSFLIRYADVFDTGEDFRQLPVARFAWQSFLVTAVWFTFTHASWEWLVAAPTGVLWNLWLYHRGHIGSTIVSHAVANGSIAAAVLLGPPSLGIFL